MHCAGDRAVGQGFLEVAAVFLALTRMLLGIALVSALCVGSVLADSGLERAGDVGQVVIPAVAGLSAVVAGDSEGIGQFYKSLYCTMWMTFALKYTVDRDRPEGHGAHSFPSGHTAAAVQGATFIQRRYGWTYGVPCYLAAGLVGWSRIEAESDKHDLLDVAGGAAIGLLVTYGFTTSHKDVAVVPMIDNGIRGICISGRW
jgi:membrane-associated phospholipid phosphatase